MGASVQDYCIVVKQQRHPRPPSGVVLLKPGRIGRSIGLRPMQKPVNDERWLPIVCRAYLGA